MLIAHICCILSEVDGDHCSSMKREIIMYKKCRNSDRKINIISYIIIKMKVNVYMYVVYIFQTYRELFTQTNQTNADVS